jgi:pimeloyl-ACP methyl ester carboxylesterase
VPSIAANGITIEYETAGDRASPPLLLIMGLGGQLTAWPEPFVASLVEQGFWVIRYDNRDVGLSTWWDAAGPADLAGALEGRASAPYLLSDMAEDAAALLDALDISRAHVLGISMGGMIAQELAIGHPGRVATLTSIMSNTGDPSVGQPNGDAVATLMQPPPADREEAIEQSVTTWRVIGSPGFPFDEAEIRRRAAAEYDRANHPDGAGRHLMAIVMSADRTARLRGLSCPTLVVHGEADPLVAVSGGRATADAVPGARLWTIPGMGHDLPAPLHAELASTIAGHALAPRSGSVVAGR